MFKKYEGFEHVNGVCDFVKLNNLSRINNRGSICNQNFKTSFILLLGYLKNNPLFFPPSKFLFRESFRIRKCTRFLFFLFLSLQKSFRFSFEIWIKYSDLQNISRTNISFTFIQTSTYLQTLSNSHPPIFTQPFQKFSNFFQNSKNA